jgi:hypothetical protein
MVTHPGSKKAAAVSSAPPRRMSSPAGRGKMLEMALSNEPRSQDKPDAPNDWPDKASASPEAALRSMSAETRRVVVEVIAEIIRRARH